MRYVSLFHFIRKPILRYIRTLYYHITLSKNLPVSVLSHNTPWGWAKEVTQHEFVTEACYDSIENSGIGMIVLSCSGLRQEVKIMCPASISMSYRQRGAVMLH